MTIYNEKNCKQIEWCEGDKEKKNITDDTQIFDHSNWGKVDITN